MYSTPPFLFTLLRPTSTSSNAKEMIKVMDGNSTKLEGVFSRQRGSGHASTGSYGTGIATNTAKANMAAAKRNPMYGTDGLEGETDGGVTISRTAGTRLYKQFTERLDAKMDA